MKESEGYFFHQTLSCFCDKNIHKPTHTQFRNPPAYGCFCYIHANLKTFELKNPLSTFKSLLISLQRRVSSSCTKPKVNENIYLKSEIFSFSKCILAYLSGGRYFS